MEKITKPRVGILTYSQVANLNYGAMLQCFALYQTIQNLGYAPVIINWQIEKKIKTYHIKPDRSRLNYILLTIKRYINYKQYLINRQIGILFGIKNFKNFSDHYLLSKTNKVTLSNIADLNQDIEIFVVGSDQVWRYNYCPDIKTFFFDFVLDSKPKISYAASFGKDAWDEAPTDVANDVKKLISRFKKISVREKSGIQICENDFNVKATHVLDPTLLLNEEDYIDLFRLNSNVSLNNKKYIGLFILGQKWKKNEINRIRNKFKLPIKNIIGKKISFMGFSMIKYNSIPNWLNTIRNAEFVITNSFHCAVFSILFRKNFVVILDKKRGNSRLESLLNDLRLDDLLVRNRDELINKIDMNRDIDYVKIHAIIKDRKILSIKFLSNALLAEK